MPAKVSRTPDSSARRSAKDSMTKENESNAVPNMSHLRSSLSLSKPPENKAKRSRAFPKLFRSKSKQGAANAVNADEVDPVMALFAARNTHRVRFCLEGSASFSAQAPAVQQGKASQEVKPTGVDKAKLGSSDGASGIKSFMKGALFGRSSSTEENLNEFDLVMAKEIGALQSPDQGGKNATFRVTSTPESGSRIFAEDKGVHAQVTKLLNKASRARHVYYRYEYAVKVCIKALNIITDANYPDDHPTVTNVLESLNAAHHALSCYRNSANIVRMGIRYEEAGEFVRALKMYSIAYRIRRDSLCPNHPSLIVLLNMLGGVQMKREELEEALEIFEIAVNDDPLGNETDKAHHLHPKPGNMLAKSVAYREMGSIYERWQEPEEALKMYNKSLECLAHVKGLSVTQDSLAEQDDADIDSPCHHAILLDLETVQLSRSYSKRTSVVKANKNEDDEKESGGMELLIEGQGKGWTKRRKTHSTFLCSSAYDIFFPQTLASRTKRKKEAINQNNSAADIDIALTLHQIGQLHRSNGDYNLAIEAFSVALRGMRFVFGKKHPNCASILGNIGNLQKEMGDMDASFETYQKVLAIESSRLGLSHPDVVITLHNIATIEGARGNHKNALELYNQVLALQRKLYGEDDLTLAVTTACKGDVYERVGQMDQAIVCFEEALRIKAAALGRHSIEVARLLHKLGKLNAQNADFHLAESFISRAILVYRLNKLPDDDEWLIDAGRDAADIDAAITLGKAGVVENVFEC